MLCSWARHFTPIVPLSTQEFKWVRVNLMLGGNPVMDYLPIQGEEEGIFLVPPARAIWPDADFTPRRQNQGDIFRYNRAERLTDAKIHVVIDNQ